MASFMSAIHTFFFLFLTLILVSTTLTLSASVIDDLNNLIPPPDFNATIINNCFRNPALRYCNSSPAEILDIFKSTIVASHLCNESKNPNCVDTFAKIDLQNRSRIAPLYLSFSFFWKYCPLTILAIDISNNSIRGPFPSDILHCSQIQSLDLSNNELTGDVPLDSFSLLTNLTFLNLSYNHFSESKISDTQFFKRFNSSSFLHSGLLPDHKKFRIRAVFLLLGFPIAIISIACLLWWLCFRRPDFLPFVFWRRHKFTPAMLNAATAGFSEKNLVGKSEGVDIYRGLLRDGTQVRIEIYRDRISKELSKKFVQEGKILVQLCHKNIVQVLGWCNHRKFRAIVTEWTDGVNIETWLSISPPWKHRLKILVGVMEGMCYLQEIWPEVDYDIRACSVLLTEDRKPLISRFKVIDHNSNTKKVYKFGILLLEMMTNRRPREEFEEGEVGFTEWIKINYPGNVQKVLDDKLKETGITYEQASQAISLALLCTDVGSRHQPSLHQVANMIARIYESSLVSASPGHKRSHRERNEGHRRIQSR